jgi:hypothetical protein
VIASDRSERSDVRAREPGEDVKGVARLRELDAVAEQENQVDSSFREPRERCVDAPVEVLRLEVVDPARTRWLELAVEVAQDADADQGLASPSMRITEVETLPGARW